MEIKDIISSGLLELYVAGLTSENETMKVEQWLSQYSELSKELTDIAANIEAYAQNFVVVPSPLVKEKVLVQINVKENDGVLPVTENKRIDINKYGVAPFWRIAAAASIALLIGSAVINLVLYNKYAETGKTLAVATQSLNSLENYNKEMEEGLSVVQSKYSVPVALNGLEAAPEAAAKIFWMKNTGEVFIDASNLPSAPAGKQYQLWGIVDGKPVDGGMLLTTHTGRTYHMQKMKSFGKAQAFAITLEPEKGNATPQGPLYVMGKM